MLIFELRQITQELFIMVLGITKGRLGKLTHKIMNWVAGCSAHSSLGVWVCGQPHRSSLVTEVDLIEGVQSIGSALGSHNLPPPCFCNHTWDEDGVGLFETNAKYMISCYSYSC